MADLEPEAEAGAVEAILDIAALQTLDQEENRLKGLLSGNIDGRSFRALHATIARALEGRHAKRTQLTALYQAMIPVASGTQAGTFVSQENLTSARELLHNIYQSLEQPKKAEIVTDKDREVRGELHMSAKQTDVQPVTGPVDPTVPEHEEVIQLRSLLGPVKPHRTAPYGMSTDMMPVVLDSPEVERVKQASHEFKNLLNFDSGSLLDLHTKYLNTPDPDVVSSQRGMWREHTKWGETEVS